MPYATEYTPTIKIGENPCENPVEYMDDDGFFTPSATPELLTRYLGDDYDDEDDQFEDYHVRDDEF